MGVACHFGIIRFHRIKFSGPQLYIFVVCVCVCVINFNGVGMSYYNLEKNDLYIYENN